MLGVSRASHVTRRVSGDGGLSKLKLKQLTGPVQGLRSEIRNEPNAKHAHAALRRALKS